MTDHFTEDLYDFAGASRVVFGLSRLICDVERFEDDEQEPMSRYGMGVCYSKNSDGEKLRDVTLEDKKHIIENYYRAHHQRLSDIVDSRLEESGSALIVDCHSFPNAASSFNEIIEKNASSERTIHTRERWFRSIATKKTKE
jgi:N-formylglutamate deformylase